MLVFFRGERDQYPTIAGNIVVQYRGSFDSPRSEKAHQRFGRRPNPVSHFARQPHRRVRAAIKKGQKAQTRAPSTNHGSRRARHLACGAREPKACSAPGDFVFDGGRSVRRSGVQIPLGSPSRLDKPLIHAQLAKLGDPTPAIRRLSASDQPLHAKPGRRIR
jgi:hypothetical protein